MLEGPLLLVSHKWKGNLKLESIIQLILRILIMKCKYWFRNLNIKNIHRTTTPKAFITPLIVHDIILSLDNKVSSIAMTSVTLCVSKG